SRFQAGDAGATRPVDYDPQATPLEVTVEREPPPAPTLRLRLDAWTRLKSALVAAGRDDAVSELSAGHPLPPPSVTGDAADARLRLIAGTGAGDGLAIAATLRSDAGGLPADLIKTFLAWVDAQTPPGAGESWLTDRLEYRFG